MKWIFGIISNTVVLNSIILFILLLFNKKELTRIRKICDILTNGGYKDCPFFTKCIQKGGVRWYDPPKEIEKEGGENL